MSINQILLAEFDMEMEKTRRVLERVPLEKSDWAPHPKSMKLGRLAQHVAEIPGWLVPALQQDELSLDGYQPEPLPRSRTELLASFDKNVTAARAALSAASDDAAFVRTWALKAGGQTMFSAPRSAVVRGFVFNHMIHHRGQLSVYLRLNDIPVPSIYGPSADEAPS